MKMFRVCSLLGAVVLLTFSAQPLPVVQGDDAGRPNATEKPDPEKSYYYYGPNGLYKEWHKPGELAKAQRLGRDTWIHWTWGNQKVLRRATILAGNLPVPVSIDFFRLLDSRNRATRFRDLGLINEPNCQASPTPDQYGLYLDTFAGDPLGYYPVSAEDREEYKAAPGKFPWNFREPDKSYAEYYPHKYPGSDKMVDDRHFGRPSGIIGLRLFKNYKFDPAKWNLREYFKNPGKVEPPYLVGLTCAFCHIAFDPKNPPKDPENPTWKQLAANVGNQYLREGELFFGKGRVLFGDKNPVSPAYPADPYATRGLTEGDFLYHYGMTQQPGTSETSRISYDFINNPNTINPIYGLKDRPEFDEHTPWGQPKRVWHVLKDGADSIGIDWALMRVPVNIGCEGDYWIDQLFNPATGRRQRPMRIAELLGTAPFVTVEKNGVATRTALPGIGLTDQEKADVQGATGFQFERVPPARLGELQLRYRSEYGRKDDFVGRDWQEAWRRVGSLKAYLLSYEPAHLQDAKPEAPDDLKVAADAAPKEADIQRGAQLFCWYCARCHSSKLPGQGLKETVQNALLANWTRDRDHRDHFLKGNFLANERRYSVTELGTNMARALATNAVHGDIWAEFSSPEYKQLAPLGRMTFDVPVFPPNAPLPALLKAPIHVEFDPPGGGRGYYRTPSLISMWATAPYLHNNSVGDYYVVKEDGTKVMFPNDGTRMGRKNPDGSWVDYRIDVSVEGRLRMFEDGMNKLLNPSQRRHWVKRTSSDSALIPDLHGSIRQLVASVAREVVQNELRTLLKEHQVPAGAADGLIKAVDGALQRSIREALKDGEVSARFAWSALQVRARDHADRVFDLFFEDVRAELAEKLRDQPVALDPLRLPLRRAFLDRLDQLDQHLREAALLKIPQGTPVNLYANLNPSALGYAVLAHVRHRDDPRALAETLLQLSDCPDLVEDHGHNYGSELSDADKQTLIQFLKTL